MRKIKIMPVFGTRPEAIKMAPVVKKLEDNSQFEVKTLVTGQHRYMLDQVLDLFGIVPSYDLDIMKEGQSLADITARVIGGLEGVLERERPGMVLVHGDTTTTFAASLCCFYHRIPVGHVEAGLRTDDKYSPYPEEMNRRLTGAIADLHFAPTKKAGDNLLKEGVNRKDIIITGNTVIDALLQVVEQDYRFEGQLLDDIDFGSKRVVLVTCHRRENLGQPMENIFNAIIDIIADNRDVEVVFPVHKNPKVRDIACPILKDIDRVHLIEPMDYQPFANLMNKCYMILTDSGGIQEEAPSLGKPVLVLRDTTERPEAVEAGTVRVVGTDRDAIFKQAHLLLNDKDEYDRMANSVNPYGDGKAADRIVEGILNSTRGQFFCALYSR
ncbi:MAG: UDP-N-acetylglucosamine 2-epimerase (non-hydrolyzing) [Clostridia bacterium]|nr:UDP-N-acetylglucosamine 2-epimerase (non-hydrolyzing) [Clostridia bacterium]